MENLFGEFCAVDVTKGFAYDNDMRRAQAEREKLKRKFEDVNSEESQELQSSQTQETQRTEVDDEETESEDELQDARSEPVTNPQRTVEQVQDDGPPTPHVSLMTPMSKRRAPASSSRVTNGSSLPSSGSSSTRKEAFEAAMSGKWHEEVRLTSVHPYQESQVL